MSDTPRTTTLEEALQVCARAIASPKFAQHVRKHAGGVFDQSYIIQVNRHKDGFNVNLEFRHRTPAAKILYIGNLT